MSNFIETPKDIKNKNGKMIEKVLNIQPKKGKLTIDEINKLYKAIIKKTNPKAIMIKVCSIDGFKTLKAYDYIDNDLTFVYDDFQVYQKKQKKNLIVY